MSHILHEIKYSIMSQLEKRITTALAGVENVYAKHVPVLLRIAESAMKGRLKDKDFPAVVTFFFYFLPRPPYCCDG